MQKIEEEIIVLNAVFELINSMVNFEIMSVGGTDPNSSVRFKSMTHMKFFNIVLVDFLSRSDNRAPIKPTSYLGGLYKITHEPNFNKNDSILPLKKATIDFKNWLEQEVTVDIWLPSIGKDTTLKITRVTFLKMTGNISKHNYLRAAGVAEELKDLLAKNDITIKLEEALFALSEFYERFYTDILGYHSSTISEFLNNIRWGIYFYLRPEYQKTIKWKDGNPPICTYTYPSGVNSKFARNSYWELMNRVKSEPYMRQFETTKWLKLRY